MKSANEIKNFHDQDKIIRVLKQKYGIQQKEMKKLYAKQLQLKLPNILEKANSLSEREKLSVYNDITKLIRNHTPLNKKTIYTKQNTSKSQIGKYLKNEAIESFWKNLGEQFREVSHKNPKDQESAIQKIKDTSFTLIDTELRNILNVVTEGKGIFIKSESKKNQIETTIRELKQGTLALTLEKHSLEKKIAPIIQNIKDIEQGIKSLEFCINKLEEQSIILKNLSSQKSSFQPEKNQQQEVEKRIKNFKERIPGLIKSRLQEQKELKPFIEALEHINKRWGNKIVIPLQQQKNDKISELPVKTEAYELDGTFPDTE